MKRELVNIRGEVKTTPAVSVVIPAYNVAAHIGEALASVFAQTFHDFEVIVVNDGSPDTAELERALAPYLSRVVYLRQENRGAAAARNTALRHARAPLIAFLDADDLWEPEYLAEQVRFLEEGGYDLAYADALCFGNTRYEGRHFMGAGPSAGELTAEDLLSQREDVVTSGVLARREVIERAGLFDEGLRRAHDFDLWLRVARGGSRLAYQRRALVRYRVTEIGLSGDLVSQCERAVAVFEHISAKYELTAHERELLEKTFCRLRAVLALERGKALLHRGDCVGAAELLREANRVLASWKVRGALLGLRIAPHLLRRVYRLCEAGRKRRRELERANVTLGTLR
jgi:glycosyltransferase involved in cell wall biosynthesis